MDPEKNSPEEARQARSEGKESEAAEAAAGPDRLGSKLHTSG